MSTTAVKSSRDLIVDQYRASRTPPAHAAGEEIVHACRKRRENVNPLVPGSSPGGPTKLFLIAEGLELGS